MNFGVIATARSEYISATVADRVSPARCDRFCGIQCKLCRCAAYFREKTVYTEAHCFDTWARAFALALRRAKELIGDMRSGELQAWQYHQYHDHMDAQRKEE